MGAVKIIITTALIALTLGYIFYLPVPADVDDPLKASIFQQQADWSIKLALLSWKIGFGDIINNTRLMSTFLITFGITSSSNEEMEVREAAVAGVRVRIYRPVGVKRFAPALIYLHGGGWIALSPEVYDSSTYEMARLGKVVVVSVDYRLAPENPYPAGFEDCVAVTEYILQHGHKHGIDTSRVGIGGDSAGGNLAAAVALKFTEDTLAAKNLPKLRFQILIYPVVQMHDFQLPSFGSNDLAMRGVLRRWSAPMCLACYMGYDVVTSHFYLAPQMLDNRHISDGMKVKYGHLVDHALLPEKYRNNSAKVTSSTTFNATLFGMMAPYMTDPYFSPITATTGTLAKSPPAIIVSAEYDVIRDDALLYKHHLEKAGVRVKHYHLERGYHPMMLLSPLAFLRHGSAVKVYEAMMSFVNEILAEEYN